MGDYLYYYATQSEYNAIKKTKKIIAPISLVATPKLKITDFKTKAVTSLSERNSEPYKWCLGFPKSIIGKYQGRYSQGMDEAFLLEDIPLDEVAGMAKFECIMNGLLMYQWVYRKDQIAA